MKNKNIVLGITGGIACYKSAELASRLIKLNYNIDVIMTKNSCEFIAPLTFQTITQNKVHSDMFEKIHTLDIEHISIAKKADIFVIVPATANFIGKISNGICDDMLTTTIMATKSPVIIAPAMNTAMWENTILQNNILKLKKIGYHFVAPTYGRLACGDTGKGKLADLELIIEKIISICK